MNIQKIRIRNFKGTKDLTLDIPLGGVKISGRNASGKTTIADAFFWAMTGRNYQGLTDGKGGFKVQNVNATEPEDAEVEITIANGINNGENVFRKVLTAKGKLEYYVNGVEHQAKEYEAYIAENVALNVALLTNPNYFASLSWQDQRALVSALAPVEFGELTSDAALVAEITTKDVETWRKSAKKAIENDKAAIQKLNTEIQTIAGMMPDTSKVEESKKEIAKIDAEVESLYSEINTLTSDDTQHAKLNEMRVNIQNFVNANKSTINDMESEKLSLQSQSSNGFAAYQREIDETRNAIAAAEQKVVDMRKRFEIRAAEMYQDNGDEIKCPLNKDHKCADLVLSEIVKNNKRDIIAKFYEQKEADLNAMEEEGKLTNAKIAELTEKMNDAIARRDQHHREMNAAIEKISAKIDETRKKLNEQYAAMQADADKFEREISESDTTDKVNKIRINIASLNARRDELTKAVGAQDIADKYAADIKKKEVALDDARKLLEKDSIRLSDGEQLIDAHAHETETRVNNIFKTCKFQMFEKLKNGTRQNTCQILINGVPYGRGANKAAEINAAIEICEVFQDRQNIALPIFVDNAESINEINTGRQVVAMYVTDADFTIGKIN